MGSSGWAVSTGVTMMERTGSLARTPAGALGCSAPTKRRSRSDTMPTSRSGSPSSARSSRIGKWRMLRSSIKACTSRMGVSGPMATTLRVMMSCTSMSAPFRAVLPMLPAAAGRARARGDRWETPTFPEPVELRHHLLRRVRADAGHERVGRAGAHLEVAGGVGDEAGTAVQPLEHTAVRQVPQPGSCQVVMPDVQRREHHRVVEPTVREAGVEHAFGQALAAQFGRDLDGAELDEAAAAIVPPTLDVARGMERGVPHQPVTAGFVSGFARARRRRVVRARLRQDRKI